MADRDTPKFDVPAELRAMAERRASQARVRQLHAGGPAAQRLAVDRNHLLGRAGQCRHPVNELALELLALCRLGAGPANP